VSRSAWEWTPRSVPLGEVLQDQALVGAPSRLRGSLVAVPFPRGAGVSEIDGDIGGDREGGVVGRLGALVVGDGPPQVVGQPPDPFRQLHGDAAGGPVVGSSVEAEEPGRSLDRRREPGRLRRLR
jgi:hypothetical protein